MLSFFNDMSDSLMPIKSGDFGFFSIESGDEDGGQVLAENVTKETVAKAAEVVPTSSDSNAAQRSQALIELLQRAIEQREMFVHELTAGRTVAFQNGSMQSPPPPQPPQQHGSLNGRLLAGPDSDQQLAQEGASLHRRRHVDMTDLLPDKRDLRDTPPPPAHTLPAARTRGPTGPMRQLADMHRRLPSALPSTARKGGGAPTDNYETLSSLQSLQGLQSGSEYGYSYGEQGSSDPSEYDYDYYSSSASERGQKTFEWGGLARPQRPTAQDAATGSTLMAGSMVQLAKAQAQCVEPLEAEEAYSYYPSYYAYYGDDGSSSLAEAAPATVGSIYRPGPVHTTNDHAVRSALQRAPGHATVRPLASESYGPGTAPLPGACKATVRPLASDSYLVRDLPRSTQSPTSDEEIEYLLYDYSYHSNSDETPSKDGEYVEAYVYDSYSYPPTSHSGATCEVVWWDLGHEHNITKPNRPPNPPPH